MKKNYPFLAVLMASFFLLIANNTRAQNSILASGTWHKLSITQTGIYKISYDDLVSFDIDVQQIIPKHIRIFGNGNGMLPESVIEFRYDDLQENSIYVHGEADGIFDPDDYILFYAEGPIEWKWNADSTLFEHALNLYDDKTCYFLTTDNGEGKRIENQQLTTNTPTYVSTSFDDYKFHELELRNLIQSGKEWYGEEFDEVLEYDFEVEFPNIITTAPVKLLFRAASRSPETGTFNIKANDQPVLNLEIPGLSFSSVYAYAKSKSKSVSFFSDQPLSTISIAYSSPSEYAIGWLDYFIVNVKRNLIFESGQLQFRDTESVDTAMITTFEVSTANTDAVIWNITNPLNPTSISFDYTGSVASFTLETDSLLNFIIFDNNLFLSPEYAGEVENQNLHAIEPPDMLLISPAAFLPQAQQLANFRETHNGLTGFIATPEKIYNEFSSGAKDVTAIKDFVKNIYDRSDGEKPVFLLLFGDASFDYKNISGINTTSNLIPTWESTESLHRVTSYCSDDFFGTFEDSAFGTLKVNIGRLPVKTPEEATAAVDKIIQYESNPEALGEWRNNIVSIADDRDGNVHLNQAEALTNFIDSTNKSFNISKIYLDAFVRDTFPNGNLAYTQVNKAITEKINSGVNIINYVGHSEYYGLAHERVLQEEDLLNWNNEDRYPFMFTASCSFGHYDNPEKYSITEQAVLMEGKGMSAIISSSRLNFGVSNHSLQLAFYSILLENPEYSLGKILALAKNQSGSFTNDRKYHLFGDPAMRLALPKFNIHTEAINGIPTTHPPDTLHPGDQIIASGFLTNREGNIIFDFNGNMNIRVFDKAVTDTTLGNDYSSDIVEFITQDSVLTNIQTEVVNGRFAVTFNLPSEIDEKYGNIKLSYYAENSINDASGYFTEIVVGGEPSLVPDAQQSENFITFFPTLVSSQLHYSTGKNLENLKIEIISLSGNLVFSKTYNALFRNEQRSIDVAGLQKGMYVIRAYNENTCSNFKIIKQ